MSIRIIVDSASDMSEKESKYLKVLPLTVTFGETQYLDGVTITSTEFYENLIESDELPKTSQIGPYDFEQAIKEVLGAGDTPLVITISCCCIFQKISLTEELLRNIINQCEKKKKQFTPMPRSELIRIDFNTIFQ